MLKLKAFTIVIPLQYILHIMNEIVSVQNLTKQFGDFTAVNDLSFSIPKGSIYGFLGQNGAGKSTTIRMLTTLIAPTQGVINMFGKNLVQHPQAILKNIGAVIERPDLYKYLTAYENVKIFAKLSDVKVSKKDIEDVLHIVGLDPRFFHNKMKTFSQGMKQRLGIAISLIHNPELIILDEPVNGLDPQGIADMRHLILKLKHEMNKTVMVSSHLLSEMQMIATDLLIIHKGKKIVEGKITDLLNPEIAQIEILTDGANAQLANFSSLLPFENAVINTTENMLVIRVAKKEIGALHKIAATHINNLISVRPQQSLEDYFLEQINKQQ